MKKTFVLAGCIAFAFSLSAKIHEFKPSDKITFRTEPKGFESLVVVSQAADRAVFDCRAAFAKGMENLVCELPVFEDPEFSGDDIIFEVFAGCNDANGNVNVFLQMRRDLDGKERFHALKSRTPFVTDRNPNAITRCVVSDACPVRSRRYRLRFDFRKTMRGGVYFFTGGRVARLAEMNVTVSPKKVKPELSMYIPFDGSARATFARGEAEPIAQKGVSYGRGLKGQAVHVTESDRTLLEYAFKDNLSQVRGAISMWIKRDSITKESGRHGKWLVAPHTPFAERLGTGAMYLWFWTADRLRMDTSDDCDAYLFSSVPTDDRWHHVVASWNEAGGSLFIDGSPYYDDVGGNTFISPLARARQPYQFNRLGYGDAFRSFFVGSWRGMGQFNGYIDELKVFTAALSREDAQKLFVEEGGNLNRLRPDYAKMSVARGRNPYEAEPLAKGGDIGELELVKEVRFDATGLERLRGPGEKFEVVGPSVGRKTADGTGYLEIGGTPFDRLAVGFELDDKEPLYVFDIDYPDDAMRTMDIIVQDAFNPFYDTKALQDYEMQVGLTTGGDYPVSGKIRTHRCLYWARSKNVAFVLMTLRDSQPAAVAAVRLYRVKAKALPVAKVDEPLRKDGWGRTIGWYYEDPAIDFGFGVKDYAATPELCMEMVDKIAATMRYQGLNMFAYPGAWYNGMINASYNPRNHATDFFNAFYERFDREGLGVVPLINQESHPVPVGSLTYDMIDSGKVHETMYSVTATGKPDCGIVRKPSLFNICHPDTQRYLEGMIDLFLADGLKHPSFKGIGLHVKHSSICWLGMISNGYNDYMIDGFTCDTGIKVPVDRKDPMRGKAYAEWLLKNAYEPWVKWRCRQVSGFWVKIARKLAAARPDLKLWINNIANLDPLMDRFTSPDYMSRMALEGGLDREMFVREAPNIIMGQTCLPADYRFANPGWYYATKADYECQRDYHTKPYYWDFLEAATYPLVHMHDRYWESHAGDRNRNRNPSNHFKAKWFKEVKWRVSTLNPPGPYAMEHFAVPMRFRDVLGFTKGGFLVGTYGMEEYLVPFAQAFRALPAVSMETLPGGGDFLRLRYVRHDGKSYFYIVNTGSETAEVSIRFPEGTKDLVSGERLNGAVAFNLGPYVLRSFVSQSGRPELVRHR